MRDLLDAVARGEVTPAAAEAELRGYVTSDAGRFDAARLSRRGIPEAILAEGKSPADVATLVATALETTDRALATRVDDDHVRAITARLDEVAPDATIDVRSTTLVAHTSAYERPSIDATVGVVTAGTVDAVVADEATVVLEELGVGVDRVEDVGVASLVRVVDQLDHLRSADVLVVAAGREGALPTVVAGLVDAPVIGLPVSSGYGYGGAGEAALAGMLQSCTVLSVVNVDAGFVAGAQAGLIARRIAAARSG